jgi:hypothetical protein
VLKGIRPLIAGLGKRSNMDRAWFELAGSRLTRDDLDAGQEDGMFRPVSMMKDGKRCLDKTPNIEFGRPSSLQALLGLTQVRVEVRPRWEW